MSTEINKTHIETFNKLSCLCDMRHKKYRNEKKILDNKYSETKKLTRIFNEFDDTSNRLLNCYAMKIADCYANSFQNFNHETIGTPLSNEEFGRLAALHIKAVQKQLTLAKISGPDFEECFSKIERRFLLNIGFLMHSKEYRDLFFEAHREKETIEVEQTTEMQRLIFSKLEIEEQKPRLALQIEEHDAQLSLQRKEREERFQFEIPELRKKLNEDIEKEKEWLNSIKTTQVATLLLPDYLIQLPILPDGSIGKEGHLYKRNNTHFTNTEFLCKVTRSEQPGVLLFDNLEYAQLTDRFKKQYLENVRASAEEPENQ